MLCLAITAIPALAQSGRGLQTDLRLVVSDLPDPVLVGQPVTYFFNVANQGKASATGLTLVVFFSNTLTPIVEPTPGWSCSVSSVINCLYLSPMPAPGSAVLPLRFTAPASPQTVQVTGTATANESEFSPGDNSSIQQTTAVVFGSADLTLSLAPSAPSASLGTPVSFTANVANAGPGNAPALQVTGTLGGSFVFSNFSIPSSWSCTQGNGTISCNYLGGSPSGTLANGVAAAPIVINGVAGPTVGPATLSLLASSGTTDPSPAGNSASIAVTAAGIPAVDLALNKTVVGTQPIPRNVGFTYRLSVQNLASSNQTANSIVITDILPAGIALQSFSGAGWTCSGAVTCNYAPSLGIGQNAVPLDLQVIYNNAVPPNGIVISNSATVSSADPDPQPANNQSTVAASFRANADLNVEFLGPTEVFGGEFFAVDLVARNLGPDIAGNVVVTGTIANGFTVGVVSGGAGWSCLASGQNVNCQRPALPVGNSTAASLVLTAPPTQGGPFAQTATISGSSFDPDSGNNSSSLGVSVLGRNVGLQLSMSDSADPVTVNTPFSYLLTVTNLGDISQSGLNIDNALPANMSYLGYESDDWECTASSGAQVVVNCISPGTELGPDESISVALLVSSSTPGTVTNSALVNTELNQSGVRASETTTIIRGAFLELTKRARNASIELGSNAIFDLTVSNPSQIDASNVVLRDDLPAGLDAVSASGTGWVCTIQSPRIECTRPTVAASSSSVVVIEARPTNAGRYVNRAQVQFGNNPAVLANDAVTVTAPPAAAADLSLQMTASANAVIRGNDFSYLLRVSNLGPSAATMVRLTDVLPANVAFLGTSSANWVCQAGPPVVCQLSGELAASADSNLTLNVRAVAVGTADNQASVSASQTDPNGNNNSANVSTQIGEEPVVTADVGVQLSGPTSVIAGGQITINTAASSAGPGAASGLSVATTIPAGFSITTVNAGTDWTCATVGQVVNCARAALAVASGSSNVAAITLTALATAAGANQVSATIGSTSADSNGSNNSSALTVNITPQLVTLSLRKSDSVDPVGVNTPFDYALTVTNTGNVVQDGLQIVDTLPAGLSYLSFSGLGWTCTSAGSPAVVSCASAASLAPNASSTVSLRVSAAAPALLTNQAQARSAQNATANATETTRITGPSADLSVQVAAPASVIGGSSLTVNLSAGNAGPDAANTVVVNTQIATELVISQVTQATGWVCTNTAHAVNCQRSTFAPGSGSVATLTLTAPNTAGGPLAINTSISGASLDPNQANNASTASLTVTGRTAGLSLTKTDSVDPVELDTPFDYVLTVTNNGNVAQDAVRIIDTLPAGLTYLSFTGAGWSCSAAGTPAEVSCSNPAPLAAGASSVVTLSVKATAAGTLTNSARSQSTQTPAGGTATQSTTVRGAPSLSLTKRARTSTIQVGSTAVFDVTVANTGPVDASNLVLIDDLPVGSDNVSARGDGWVCTVASAQVVRVECRRAGLARATSSVVTVEAKPRTAGTYVNRAQVQADRVAVLFATDSVIVSDPPPPPATADLEVTATAPSSVAPGARVDVQARIRNVGPSAAANVVFLAPVSGPWALQSGSGAGFTCTVIAGGLDCRGASLAAGASVDLQLQGQANATANAALVSRLSVASGTTDPVAANNAATVSIAIATPPPQSADLSISKTDSVDPVTFGERFTYTLTARNLGPSSASNVIIRDPLPAGLVFVSAAGAGLTCTGGGVIDCRASSALASGQQLVVTVTVDAPSVRGSITNQATVESSTTDPVASNNRASQSTAVEAPEGSEGEDALMPGTAGDTIAGDAVGPVVALCDNSTGQVSTLCDALYRDAAAGRDDQVNEALRSLYPEEVLAQHASLNQLANTQVLNIDARMAELRGGGGGGFSTSGLTVINGSQAIPVGLLQSLFENDEEPQIGGTGDLISPWGFFVNGSITRGDQRINSTEREVVQDFDSVGITAGVDYRRSARWVMGAALGYNRFDSNLTDLGRLETDGFTLTGYSAYYLNDNTYFDTRLSYGRVSLDQSRKLRVNLTGFTLDEVLTGNTDASQMIFASSLGRHISRGAWTFTPNAFVRYMRSSVDGFAEEGSAFGVRYGDQAVNSLVFGAGLQVSRVISLANGVLTPQFDLVWNQESGSGDTVIDASYVGGQPGEFFRLRPETPDKSYGSVGFGLVYILANGKQAFLQLRESIGTDGLNQSTVNFGARFEF